MLSAAVPPPACRWAEAGSWGARQGWEHSLFFSPSRATGEPEAGGDYVKVRGAGRGHWRAQSLFQEGQSPFLAWLGARSLRLFPGGEGLGVRAACGVCFQSQHLLPMPSIILSWPQTQDFPMFVTTRLHPAASWTGPRGWLLAKTGSNPTWSLSVWCWCREVAAGKDDSVPHHR